MKSKQETTKSWITGISTSINNEVIQPLQNAKQIIWKYNQAIQHNSLTQEGWERLLAQSNDGLKMYLTGLNGAEAGLSKYLLSLVRATAKTISLQFATIALNSAIAMGASLIISGIVSAISSWINKTENMISTSENSLNTIKCLNNELKNNQNTINDTAKRFAELSQGVDQLTGKNISLTSDDYEEFLNLSNQLAEMFPTLTCNYNDNDDAIVQLSGDVDTIVASLHNLIEAQKELTNRQIAEELPTIFDGLSAKSDSYERQLLDLKSRNDTLVKSLGNVQNNDFTNNFMNGFSDKWIKIAGDNLEVISQIRADYIKILTDAHIDFEELTPDYEVKDGIEVPVEFTIKINSSDEDIEKAKLTIGGKIDELAKQYKTDIEKLDEKIKVINDKNKANWNNLNYSIFAWLSTDDSFKVMDDTIQATVQNIVNSLDWGSLDFSSWKDAEQYIQDNILSLFNTPKGKQTLADIQVMLGVKTLFNNGDISINDYQNKIQELLDNIKELPDDTKKTIMWLFGINFNEDGTTTSNIDPLIENIKGKLQDEFDDKVGELTFEELHIAAEQVEVPEGTLLSWNELIAKIKKIQDTPPEPVLLSEDKIKSIDNYKNKLKELYTALNLLRTKEMTSSDIDELTKNFPELSKYIDNIGVLEEQIQALINENLISLKKEFDGVISEEALKELSEYTVKMENIDSSINSTVSAIDNITSAYQSLNKAIEEYNENGYVSLQTLEEIMKIKPEYLSAFIDENGKIKSNTDAYKELVKIHLEEYELSAKDAYGLARKKNAKAIKEAAEDYGKNAITLEEYERRIGALGLDDYRIAIKFIKSVEEQLEKNPDSILSPDSPPTSDFEQKIDLASQSITTLQHNLSSLQNVLSDVSGYNNQIEAIDNIIEAQGNLYTGYENSKNLYQKQYENSLNNGILAKHGLSKLVKEKIESGTPFFNEDSIEKEIKFGNISITQQDYENIKDAISWYNKVLEAEENLTKTKSEIDESKLSKYDVLRKKSEAHINTLENSQKNITDTIDFNGNKATEEQYNNLILYQMGIRKVLEDRYKYESSLLNTLNSETDQYAEQEKLVRECADGLVECDKSMKDWQLDILRLELEAIDDEIDSINDKIKANQDEIDEKDKLISGAVGILNQEVKVQEGLRDVIQDRIDALQEENDEHERALALEKAKYELQRAYSQRTVKLYSGEERGFIYTQDREAVRDAQENLDKLEYEETIHALQEQVGYYDDIIDNLNAIKDSWSNISSNAQEFLEIEKLIARYGVGIKDSILSGSYDTDGLTQSYKGLLHLGDEFDNDLKKQEALRADLEESIEQFQNGTITLEQCLTDIGTLLGKVYDISESELQEKTEDILRSIGFLPSEADNAGNTVKALEKEVQNSTGHIKDDMNQITKDVDDTSSIAAGKVTENLIGETDKQRIIITDFAGYIDSVFTTTCNTILSIFQLLSNAVKDIFAPANTELPDMEINAMPTGSTTANDGKELTQSVPSLGEEYTTAATYQEGGAILTPFQNEQFETLIKNAPNMPALTPYHAVFMPNLNNSPTSITPVVQNITLTLPNVTNENGYGSLVNVLKSLPLDSVQYTHKK